MRKVFQECVDRAIRADPRLTLFLGDIGVHAFSKLISDLPEQAMNFGIMEQSMVSFASGTALGGKIPILHTIAPFLVLRAFEQIKLDFGYQRLPGKFISVGGSFDYSNLGATHHSPDDVLAMSSIPGMKVYCPGTDSEVREILDYELLEAQDSLAYIRLSEVSHGLTTPLATGVEERQNGELLTVVAIGATGADALDACAGLDAQVLTMHTYSPFPWGQIFEMASSRRILVVEPVFERSASYSMPRGVRGFEVDYHGVPHEFIRDYGTRSELKAQVGLSSESIRERVLEILNDLNS